MPKLKNRFLAAVTIVVIVVVCSAVAAAAVTGTLTMSPGDTEAVTCPNTLTTSDSTPNALTLDCAPDTTTTSTTATTVPVTTTTVAPANQNVVVAGDSLTGDYYWRGYIGSGLAADLTAQGFGPTLALKGCGGMSLAQFVGRVAPDGAPQDAACKTANTLTARAASIAGAEIVVPAFITNDWPYTSAQFRADVHTTVARILALDPGVHRIVFLKNYMTGTHSADLVAQVAAEANPKVVAIDVSGAYGGNYSTCANPANQNHPTAACWTALASNIAGQLAGLR